MSLVIAAISKDNDIVVCSEGRSVNPITDEILAEDTIKAFKLNKLTRMITFYDTEHAAIFIYFFTPILIRRF